jgi:predicted porin
MNSGDKMKKMKKMNKPFTLSLLGAALLGVALTPALAQTASPGAAPASSSLSAYGVADLAVYAKQFAGDAKLNTLQSGGMTTSRLGFAGSEDLGSGLKAIFDISGFVRVDSGDTGRNATDPFWARGAYVGLSSANLGLIRLGRIPTATFGSELSFGSFLDSTNLNPYVLHTYQPSGTQPMITGNGAMDSAWSNSVAYSLPSLSGVPGLSASVQIAVAEGGTTGKRLGGGVTYRGNAFGASLTFDDLKNGTLAVGAATAAAATAARPQYTAERVQTLQGGAYYDLKVVKLMAQMSQTTFKNATPTEIKLRTTALSATVPVGAGSVLLEWAHTNNDRTGVASLKRDTLGIGYDHNLSRRTDLYLVALQDKVSNLSTGNGLALGLRHRF